MPTATPSPQPADNGARYAQVELTGVRKVFGRQVALAGTDTSFVSGEVTALLGPNGAGKSTLLSILATLARPSSGEVRYGDVELARARVELRHTIGLLAHAPLLYRELGAVENLRFFARLYGVKNVNDTVDELIERVGMTHARDRPVANLSRGMTQRISLARTLLHEPQLLLLDEPFSGLDADAVELLRQQIATWRDSGRIIIVVTHDVPSIGGLCNRLLVLDRGYIVGETRAEEVFKHEVLRQRYDEALHGEAEN